ncbi:MAG: UDP-2,3-diacylglucosamine diphosphatase [Gammaproteobacteria bacterium RIFCSPHIGHO2_12_FULL_38_14]|nr:MAG: UDP-2,3-diacylglucosamine diphosphatase [Gammaproteobacteria bacterium RIFCSPHIGHO2_12_FULL_38_14]
MKNKRKTFFISDLHLNECETPITQNFLALLEKCNENIDALYILGDLFEMWIGDDDLTPFHQTIMQALKRTSIKTPIYFIPGNRDFLIGKKFLQSSSCQLLQDETKIELYGTPVLLMHGDTLCTQDTAYLKWRTISHHLIIRALYLSLPLQIRKLIAHHVRNKSKSYAQKKSKIMMDVTKSAVQYVMNKHQTNYLIHGHTHQPAIHQENSSQTRIVLGAWHEKCSVLIWNEDREIIMATTIKDLI